MDLRDLQYFETIAELGHLGRAAEALHRSAPALTKCIHRLEETFGAQLFERVGRGIRLTPIGQALLARARVLRVAVNETSQEIDELAHGIAGHVRLGVAPTVAQYLLPAVCKLLLTEAKDVTLETVIGIYPVLREALRSGQVDLAVSAIPQIDDDFVLYPIIDDEVVVVAGNEHEIFREKEVRIQDLLTYRWVLPAKSYEAEGRQWLERVFDQHGLQRPRVQIQTNSVSLLPRLIAQTGLLSFVSRRTLGPEAAGALLKEVCLEATTMRRRFGIIHRKNGYLSPAARRLETLLRTHGKNLFFEP